MTNPDKEALQTRAKALFLDLDACDADVAAAEELVRVAETKRATKLKEIAEVCGMGPYVRKGQVCHLVKRGDGFMLKVETPKPAGLVID